MKPEQVNNLYENYPEKVKEMDQGIEEYKAGAPISTGSTLSSLKNTNTGAG